MQLKKLKCINALDLKILAMLFMLCDHLWATIIPGNQWLTNIGRLAFPIFAFQIAEGYFKTKNFQKYLKRIFIFALISELPFNLMYGGSLFYPFHQNVLFTFCIALLFIRWMDRMKPKGRVKYLLSVLLSCVAGFLIGTITMVDYFGFGVLTVIVFYLFHEMKYGWIGEFAGLYYINAVMMAGLTISISLFGHRFDFPQQALALFSLIPIWMYNEKQGPHNRGIQIACYFFYPVHMLILALIWLFILN